MLPVWTAHAEEAQFAVETRQQGTDTPANREGCGENCCRPNANLPCQITF